MISVVTPTHDTRWLPETYKSICNQQGDVDWEWVVICNGIDDFYDHPDLWYYDQNVRTIIAPEHLHGRIGALKKFGFEKATGDIIVELDHDDLLTPDCLVTIQRAFDADPSVGFVYSDSAVLGDLQKFNQRHGWEFQPFEWNGDTLWSAKSFEPSAASLSSIWYAPDHVRAWRKSVYEAIGGHDLRLSVCDDHDLLIRTYLATKMVHVPRVLYIYRVHGENTWLKRNGEIQTATRELYETYARTLAEHDARRDGLGVTNNVPRKHPWKANCFGALHLTDVVQQWDNPLACMDEIYTYLADGGWAFISVPSSDGRGAFQDPRHKSYWNENTFWYYTDPNYASLIGNTDIKFQAMRIETKYPSDWHRDHHIPYVYADLRAVKSDTRRPGLNLWRGSF